MLTKRTSPCLHTRDVATKDLGLEPVDAHEDAVAGAEAHADVGASPEKVRQGTTAGNVARQPRDIGNSLLGADVGEGSLVSVLERTDLLNASEALLKILDVREDNVTGVLAGSSLLLDRELGELGLDLLGLGHLVEHASEPSTLLGGDLGGGGVVGDSAVTDGPHVLAALDNEVLVHGETTAGILLSGDLADEVLDERAEGVTGGPDEQAEGDLLDNLLSVGAGGFSFDVLVGHLLDHGLGADGDGLLLEGLLSVLNQLLGEHRKDVGERLDKGNLEGVLDLGEPLLQIGVEEVLELTGELNTGRSTTDDNHVQQTLDLLGALVLEGGRLAAIHDTVTDTLGIAYLLQEETVFAHTGDTLALLVLALMETLDDSPKVAFSAPTPMTSISKGTSVADTSPLISESSLM